MSEVSFEAAVAQLVGFGFSREESERQARIQLLGETPAAKPQPRPEAQEVRLPCRFTIPWSLLISDNDRQVAGMRAGKPIMLTRSSYTQAKNKIVEIATRATECGIPVKKPLEFVGKVYPPKATRVDPTNFAKLVQDALSCVVYSDDKWLWRVVWERHPADVDQPRAEITITALPGATS